MPSVDDNLLSRLRIGVVGHRTWFENHYPENWQRRHNVLCLDVDEWDYSFLTRMINFRPDITLFYRPELYPRRYVESIRGQRVAFLSEPLAGEAGGSTETQLRERVYSQMPWSAYDAIWYYDPSKAPTVRSLGWPISGFRPLPIDTSRFRPRNGKRDIDVCFVGKPTPHRAAVLDFLRSTDLNFVWLAHGVSGAMLASVMRRSKIVLNIHADGLPALEPRIYLGAACGALVLSEGLGGPTAALSDQIVELTGPLSYRVVKDSLDRFWANQAQWQIRDDYRELSTDKFIRQLHDRTHR